MQKERCLCKKWGKLHKKYQILQILPILKEKGQHKLTWKQWLVEVTAMPRKNTHTKSHIVFYQSSVFYDKQTSRLQAYYL